MACHCYITCSYLHGIFVISFQIKSYSYLSYLFNINGPRHKKTCLLGGGANNTGADQPTHPRSLSSVFVIHFVESIICNFATGEISFFYPVCVAEETGLKLVFFGNPEDRFSGDKAQIINTYHSLWLTALLYE